MTVILIIGVTAIVLILFIPGAVAIAYKLALNSLNHNIYTDIKKISKLTNKQAAQLKNQMKLKL